MKTPDPRDKMNANRRLALGYQYRTLSTGKLLRVFLTTKVQIWEGPKILLRN